MKSKVSATPTRKRSLTPPFLGISVYTHTHGTQPFASFLFNALWIDLTKCFWVKQTVYLHKHEPQKNTDAEMPRPKRVNLAKPVEGDLVEGNN